jgi:hypothetical protein
VLATSYTELSEKDSSEDRRWLLGCSDAEHGRQDIETRFWELESWRSL